MRRRMPREDRHPTLVATRGDMRGTHVASPDDETANRRQTPGVQCSECRLHPLLRLLLPSSLMQ